MRFCRWLRRLPVSVLSGDRRRPPWQQRPGTGSWSGSQPLAGDTEQVTSSQCASPRSSVEQVVLWPHRLEGVCQLPLLRLCDSVIRDYGILLKQETEVLSTEHNNWFCLQASNPHPTPQSEREGSKSSFMQAGQILRKPDPEDPQLLNRKIRLLLFA